MLVTRLDGGAGATAAAGATGRRGGGGGGFGIPGMERFVGGGGGAFLSIGPDGARVARSRKGGSALPAREARSRSMTFAGFSRAFRWNDGVDTERYAAVEVRADGLFFYEWSHLHGAGRTGEQLQPFSDFRARGPAVPVPASVRVALEEIVRALEPD